MRTWTRTLRGEERLRVFENKVLRKVFGPKRDDETGEWRRQHKGELHDLYGKPDIIRTVKSRRLRWAGHVTRMGNEWGAWKLLVWKPEGKRPVGRPRTRSIITSCRVNGRVRNGNIHKRPARKSSKPNHPHENWCLVFWDSEDPVLKDYQERVTTINSARYSEKLADRLKPAIRSKRRGLLSKSVLCCCTTMPGHILLPTLLKLKFEVMAHPPYSLALVPCDFHLICQLKEVLRGRRLTRTKKWRKLCMRGSLLSRKPSFWERVRFHALSSYVDIPDKSIIPYSHLPT